jgi:hypothetical protein
MTITGEIWVTLDTPALTSIAQGYRLVLQPILRQPLASVAILAATVHDPPC